MELQIIQNKIYEIRGRRVMLDFDLEELYGTETKRLKEAVRRNMERFEGIDFMFQLTKDETSHPEYSGPKPMIIGEYYVAIKKQIINT